MIKSTRIKFKVQLNQGMRLYSIRFGFNSLLLHELDEIVDNHIYEGEIEVWQLGMDKIEVVLKGSGEGNMRGRFNCSVNGMDLFDTDQELIVSERGRFLFSEPDLKIP